MGRESRPQDSNEGINIYVYSVFLSLCFGYMTDTKIQST